MRRNYAAKLYGFHAAKLTAFYRLVIGLLSACYRLYYAAKLYVFSCSKVCTFFHAAKLYVTRWFFTGKVNEIDMKKIINFASLISYLFHIFHLLFTSYFFRLWEGQNAKNICIILSKIRFALFSRKYKFINHYIIIQHILFYKIHISLMPNIYIKYTQIF